MFDLGEVVGRDVPVEIKPEIKIKISGRSRIVRTAQGEIKAIGGGHEQPVTVFDAGRILGRFGGQEVRRAVARDRGRKRRNFRKG